MGIIDMDEFEEHGRDNTEALRFLRDEKGYDGIVYNNVVEDPGSDSYIVFNPSQVKSAIGNKGTFDPDTRDIRASNFQPKAILLDSESWREWEERQGDDKPAPKRFRPTAAQKREWTEIAAGPFEKRHAYEEAIWEKHNGRSPEWDAAVNYMGAILERRAGYDPRTGNPLPGKAGDTARAKLQRQEQASNTADAQRAISDYSEYGYQTVNSILRGKDDRWGKMPKAEGMRNIEMLDEAFANPSVFKVVDKPTVVYRGISDDRVYRSLAQRKRGDVIRDKAFLSTSRLQRIGEVTSEEHGMGAVLLEIQVPKGTKYLSGRKQQESEMILNRGTKLRIVKMKRTPASGRGDVARLHVTVQVVK